MTNDRALFQPGRPGEGIRLDAKDAIDEAVLLRGWILSWFAQVEFTLAYLVESSARFPEYKDQIGKLPRGVGQRAERARFILSLEGPLAEHREPIGRLIAEWEAYEELRNYMAHGFTTLMQAKNGYFMRFRRYVPEKGADWKCMEWQISLETLRAKQDEVGEFAERAMNYFGPIFIRYGLENPTVGCSI